MCARATGAMVSAVMPRRQQYSDANQSANELVPSDALHPTQHNAMLAGVMIVASFTMCSHDGAFSSGTNLNRKNFCRATLLWILICVVPGIAYSVVIGTVMFSNMQPGPEPTMNYE